jgi:hypothetical protein
MAANPSETNALHADEELLLKALVGKFGAARIKTFQGLGSNIAEQVRWVADVAQARARSFHRTQDVFQCEGGHRRSRRRHRQHPVV